MGYSCTTAAIRTLQAVKEMFGSDLTSTNEIRLGGRLVFFEHDGRERPDGAIVGDVYDVQGARLGLFRIEGSGEITRFQGLPRTSWSKVLAMAKAPAFRPTVAVI